MSDPVLIEIEEEIALVPSPATTVTIVGVPQSPAAYCGVPGS